jgi:hypothetical protein
MAILITPGNNGDGPRRSGVHAPRALPSALVLYPFSYLNGPMHPPQFRPTHKLSDWPECVIELQCCGGSVGYPVRLLIKRRGDMTFENLVKRLRCNRCGKSKPAPVYLVAGHHRTARFGPDADWAVELVPPPAL